MSDDEEEIICWSCWEEAETSCHVCGMGLCLNCRTWMAPGAYGHAKCVDPKEGPKVALQRAPKGPAVGPSILEAKVLRWPS